VTFGGFNGGECTRSPSSSVVMRRFAGRIELPERACWAVLWDAAPGAEVAPRRERRCYGL